MSETVEVPVTVEVTREVVEVQQVEVTREVEVEVEATRLITNEVEVTRLIPVVPPGYLAGGVWQVSSWQWVFLDDGTWIVPNSAAESFEEEGQWRLENNVVTIERRRPCPGTELIGEITEVEGMNRFTMRASLPSPCEASDFGSGVARGQFVRLQPELPEWIQTRLDDTGG